MGTNVTGTFWLVANNGMPMIKQAVARCVAVRDRRPVRQRQISACMACQSRRGQGLAAQPVWSGGRSNIRVNSIAPGLIRLILPAGCTAAIRMVLRKVKK